MWNELFARNSLVPLLLRVVLAVIFVYTGLQKTTGLNNDWGALWAANLKNRDVKPPADVVARLNQFLKDKEQLRADASPDQKKTKMREFIDELTREAKAGEEGKPQEGKEGEGATGEARKSFLLPPDIVTRIEAAYTETVDASSVNREQGGALALSSSIQLLVAWGELLGGIALLLGVLTRWAALGLIVIQIGAIYLVTWAQGFTSLQGGGYGYNVALIAMLVALVLAGGGALALDRLLPWGRRATAREPATMAMA
jgi:uncharacterized membrane protein YphA (DoxX/SURF4 family)